MILDIRISTLKARAAAAEAETPVGAAGVSKTRRELPLLLTDSQTRFLNEFCSHVHGIHQRAMFREDVLSRLSGSIGNAALRAAILATSIEAGFSAQQMKQFGLMITVNHAERGKLPGFNSKAAQGAEF
jgi:hypothetical protein